MEIKTRLEPEKKYKNFNETYSLCAFSLAFAFLYPNRSTVFKRFITVSLIIAFNGGQLFWFITYTFKCLYNLDIYNFSRNMTLAVVLILFFIKTYYVIYATPKFALLLNWMSRDLLRRNDLTQDYLDIYQDHINEAKYGEWSWLIIPTVLSGFFPFYAGICMTIGSIQTDDYTKMMVHDMDMIFVEDIQSEAPFFHLYFAYNCCQCVVLVPNYCGFDGSFCIATTHLRMKLKLMIRKLQRAYEDSKTQNELKTRVSDAIRDHQEAVAFYGMLQDVYGPWLFAVFMLTSFMISFNLYQLYLLQRLEPKYTIFGIVGVLHIYLPCRYASRLTEIGDHIGSEIYNVPWEKFQNPEVTRMLAFMIARAQKTLIITGWIVVFNMELFKSILQTSYSFLTLITA